MNNLSPKYKLITATPDYLVVDKPAGLLTHGAPHIREDSLIEQVAADHPEVGQVGDDPQRPGLMHRLDKLASGLLVIARSQDSFDDLKRQFKARTVSKSYQALVYGQVISDGDDIDFPITRSVKGHKMAALPLTVKGEKNEDGRLALTEFEVKQRFINFTLLEARIKTGRTHQIRVHLSAYGHPLVGDDLYATKKTKIKNQKINLGRIFLHAEHLEFDDLKGERQKFDLDLPQELKNFLKNIK